MRAASSISWVRTGRVRPCSCLLSCCCASPPRWFYRGCGTRLAPTPAPPKNEAHRTDRFGWAESTGRRERIYAGLGAAKRPCREPSFQSTSFQSRWGGGAEGDRTPDLLIANEALSQLSYGPKGATGCARWRVAAI